jgi:hypothetical protein
MSSAVAGNTLSFDGVIQNVRKYGKNDGLKNECSVQTHYEELK